MVLGVLEGLESVGHEGFVGPGLLPELLLEEQTVAAETLAVAHDGGGGDGQLAGDLAEGGAGQRAVEDGGEEIGSPEPVGGLEGLETEGDAA